MSCRPTLDYVNQYKALEDFGWFSYDIAAATLSSISLLLIAALILFDKRLHMHPNKMIAYVCVCDAYGFCQFVMRYYICGYTWSHYLNEIFLKTVQVPFRRFGCRFSIGSSFDECWELQEA